MIVFCAGISGARLVTSSDLDAAVNEFTKEKSSLVKVRIEARLCRVGTVGAMLVNEFINNLKSADS